MPLEIATTIDELVTTNPASSDGMNNADDHMRMLKNVLKNTFPGADGPLGTVDGGFLSRTSGTVSAPAYSFAEEPTLGIFRESAGVMKVVGGKLKGGSPTGGLHMFLVEPPALGKAGTGTGYDYLELDGSTWPNASFPDLATQLGQGGTTFTLPNAYATGRFPRSRTSAVAAGTVQANTVGPHTHPDVTATTGNISADHTHAYSGTTGGDSPDHTHSVTVGSWNNSTTGGGSFTINAGATTVSTGGASTRHAHSFGGTTGGVSSNHTHNVIVSTPANTGTTETRPEALSVVLCIKT